LQLTYAHVFHWPLTLGRSVALVSQQTTTPPRNVSPQDYEELLKAYRGARNQSANLQAELQETSKQLALLTKLQAKPGLSHMQMIPAKITMLVQDELTIGQGRDSGVAIGQYVLSLTEAGPDNDNQCVIGVVSAVDAKGAKVKLITDPKSHLLVRIGKLSMVMEGRGDGTAKIRLVPTSHAIRAGDLVYAQAKPGALGAPMIVAEVAQCKRDAETPHVWDITVRPACDLAALTDVVVLKPLSAP
jgi:cell shape-determining protein MreC